MMGTLGFLRDPDQTNGNDFKGFVLRSTLKASSSDVSLREFCTDTSQWDIGACAGNATADSIEILSALAHPEEPAEQLSRLFVYSMARTRDGTLEKDGGTYIRSCFDVLSTLGICKETTWPYDTSKVFVSPSLLAQREALGHKIHSYYRIKATGDGRLDEIVSALKSHHPVVFGTLIDSSFMPNSGSGLIDKPVGNTIGGHAMIVVGYIEGNFLVKNSWGSNWRDGGFALFTPEYMMWDETCDLWVPTLGFED
jgi:C1A family cysteine protease